MRANHSKTNDMDHIRTRLGLSFIGEARMSGARQVGMRLLIAMAAALALLAGCDHHDDDDDFIVSFPSAFEIAIHRVSDRPFDVIEIGVTPFLSPIFDDEPYAFVISGISWFDGDEIIVRILDDRQLAIIDPLRESVVDVLMTCDCFVDYVILDSEDGTTTLFFN